MLETLFHLKENGTTVRTELVAGATTFLTMAYIALVNPQILSKTGHYRIFPVTGTFIVAIGYFVLTFLTVDKPLWFLMIAMFLIGLGLGQLMQTLTIASQNSVEATQMGVATSASTFFVPKPRTGLLLRCFADDKPS